MRLRTYVSLLFVAIVVLLTAYLSYIIGRQATERVQQEIGDSLANTAYQTIDKMNRFMWARSKELSTLSSLEQLSESPVSSQPLLDRLKREIPVFSWIAVINPQGIVQAATDGILLGQDISTRPVFQYGRTGTYVGDVHDAILLAKALPPPKNGEPLQFVDISTPIYHKDGSLAGVLAAHLSWEWASEVTATIVQPLQKQYKGLEVFVVSRRGRTVLLGPTLMRGQSLSLPSLTEARKQRFGWTLEKWPDRQKYLTGYALDQGYQDYKGLGWTLLIRQPKEQAFASVRNLTDAIIQNGIVAAVLFAIIGWLLAGRVTNPLQSIAVYANRLRAGEAVHIPAYQGIKDIEVLALSLRELVDSLIHTTSRLGKMEDLAQHDRLTGLPNRTALEQYITEAERMDRGEKQRFTVLYLDLDGFKQVNDTFGHHVGDILLQQVASRLQDVLRAHDMAFRLGGDEFLLILQTSSQSVKEGTAVAKRVIQTVNQSFHIENQHIQVGCSVGGSVWRDDDLNLNQVIRYADQALYQVKRTGKNQVLFHRT